MRHHLDCLIDRKISIRTAALHLKGHRRSDGFCMAGMPRRVESSDERRIKGPIATKPGRSSPGVSAGLPNLSIRCAAIRFILFFVASILNDERTLSASGLFASTAWRRIRRRTGAAPDSTGSQPCGETITCRLFPLGRSGWLILHSRRHTPSYR
jgi:hypothetical protein